MPKILWKLPFLSSWGGDTQLYELLKRNLALIIEGDEKGDVQIVFEQVEAYKCTFIFARTDEMLVAYDRLVDLGETNWLTEVKNRLRELGEGVSPPSGPPQQLGAHDDQLR